MEKNIRNDAWEETYQEGGLLNTVVDYSSPNEDVEMDRIHDRRNPSMNDDGNATEANFKCL